MGPLSGLRVIEIDALGPVPLCAMLLADLGATVLRITRAGDTDALLPIPPEHDVTARGRPSLALDLKSADGRAALMRLIDNADALIEGFRPGVAERLGIGPDACLARNPKLVFVRVTGWGQTGPRAHTAGHDITYLAATGVLDAIGRAETPSVPLNMIADYAGGTMFAAVGLLAAVLHARTSGVGQAVDVAMVDGVAVLSSLFHAMRASGAWDFSRGENLLDGGAPFYDVYETADGRHVAVGALEPKFFAEFAARIGLPPSRVAMQYDRATWPALRVEIAAIFVTRTRDAWGALLEDTDACVAGVLRFDEAASHPHALAREAYAAVGGATHPAAAPRFSATPARADAPSLDETLRAFGVGQVRK